MTWQPKLDLMSSFPFMNNLKGELEAKLPEALPWAQAKCGIAESLPEPEGIYFARAQRAKYPVINILLVGGDPQENADGGEDEDKQILVEYETQALGVDLLQQIMEASILAIRSVAREMSEEDWWGDVEQDTRGDLQVSVGKERYGQRTYDSEKTFVQVGSVIITINYTENSEGEL